MEVVVQEVVVQEVVVQEVREEAYHYTHVGGGCMGTTYIGLPPCGHVHTVP